MEDFKTFLVILSPFAPHIAEGLWQQHFGSRQQPAGSRQQKLSVTEQEWPGYNEAILEDREVTIVVQVDGRVRGSVVIARDTREPEVIAAARAQENVKKWLQGKEVRNAVVVPNRLVNFVVE